MASSTAFNCFNSSSRLDTDFFAGPEFTGDVAPRFLPPPDSLSLGTSFLLVTVVTAAANPAPVLAFNLGLAAALSRRAWRARRAPELPDDDDECDSLSDSLEDDDDSEPEDEDREYFFLSLLRLDILLRP